MSDFDPSNAVAVNETSQGTTPADTGSFNVDNAVPVNEENNGNTNWENFSKNESKPPQDETNQGNGEINDATMPQDDKKQQGSPSGAQVENTPKTANPGVQEQPSKEVPREKYISNEDLMQMDAPNLKPGQKPLTKEAVKSMSDFPDHSALNTFVTDPAIFVANDLERHMVQPITGNAIVNDQDDVDRLSAKHPVSSFMSGFSSWIVSAPLFPMRLLQFAGMPLLNDIAQERVHGSLMDTYSDTTMKNKAMSIAKDIGESVATERLLGATEAFEVGASKVAGGSKLAFYPISQAEKYLKRPFANFLAKVGVIATGNTVMHTMYGDDLAQSFKDGALQGALLHMGEVPHLAQTALGRGLVAHLNRYMDEHELAWTERQKQLQQARDKFTPGVTPFTSTEIKGIKFNLPITHINPDDPNKDHLQTAIHMAVDNIASDMKDIHNPKIVAATIRLKDKDGNFSDKSPQIHSTSHDEALARIGGTKLFRGGLPFNKEQLSERGLPLTTDKSVADTFADIKNQFDVSPAGKILGRFPNQNITEEYILNSRARIATKQDIPEELFNQYKNSKPVTDPEFGETLLGKWAKSHGFDAIDFRTLGETSKGESEIKVINPDIVSEYQAGFQVLHPDGKTRFITRAESMKEPFNLPTGHSEEVKGLSESKFYKSEPDPKITNKDTLNKLSKNDGKMDINLVPFAAELSETIPKAVDEMVKTFVPPDVNDPAKFTAMSMRQYAGIMARNRDIFFDSMENARKFFNKATKESIIENYTKSERGEKLDNPELQKIFDALKRALRFKAEEVQKRTGKLQDLIDNYLVHAWEKPGKVKQLFASIFGKRPFEGGKSFLKKRTIEDFDTGIKAGLTPISWNPVDLTMFKLNEMDRYLMAHEVKVALKDKSLRVFVRTGGEKPENWIKINDPAEEVYYTNDAKELVKAGVYYTHPDAARIIDNYLSPGLRNNYLYNLYRSASNSLIQARLSLSAFHAQFVTNDANISSFSLGLNKIGAGMVKEGIADMAKSAGFLVAPIQTVQEGMKLNEAWHGRSTDPTSLLMASLYSKGGGRASMDRYYAIEADKAINKALKDGKYMTAAFHTPFWLLQQTMRPIMEFYVPRMKMGVFANLMKFELAKNPNMSETELLGKAQLAVDTVDDRMGQLVYDNLFINKTLKDLGMASVQSFGWNIGDVRLFGGGAVDLVKNLNEFRQGKGGDLSYRLAYVMSMPIVMGFYGAVYQYLHTGKLPGQGIEDEGMPGVLKDLYFPRNGGIDQRGSDSRTSLADYVKDVYHFAQDPIQTAINKLNPINDEIMSMIRNKDFYNTKIYNEDDLWPQQWKDLAGYAVTSNISYSIQSAQRSTNKSLENKVESFFGFNTAPLDINMTSAEKEARTLSLAHMSPASRTKQEAQHSQKKSQLFADYIASGKDESVLVKAVDDGTISVKEKRQMLKQSDMSNLQRWTQDLTFEEVFHVLNKGNPSEGEKKELQEILNKKRENKKERDRWTEDEESLYARSFALTN